MREDKRGASDVTDYAGAGGDPSLVQIRCLIPSAL